MVALKISHWKGGDVIQQETSSVRPLESRDTSWRCSGFAESPSWKKIGGVSKCVGIGRSAVFPSMLVASSWLRWDDRTYSNRVIGRQWRQRR